MRAALLALSLLLGACGDQPEAPPEVRQAWLRLVPSGSSMTAAYATLHNPSGTAKVLVGVEIDSFRNSEIHETRDVDGVSQMRAVSSIRIEPGSTIKLEPGSYHIMAMGRIKEGTSPAIIRFTFADGSILESSAEWRRDAPETKR